MEQTERVMWTEHLNKCDSCKRTFRVERGALEVARADNPSWTDDQIVESFDYCMGCTSGEITCWEYPEHDLDVCLSIIRRAHRDLGPDLGGSYCDLICDNSPLSTHRAAEIADHIQFWMLTDRYEGEGRCPPLPEINIGNIIRARQARVDAREMVIERLRQAVDAFDKGLVNEGCALARQALEEAVTAAQGMPCRVHVGWRRRGEG